MNDIKRRKGLISEDVASRTASRIEAAKELSERIDLVISRGPAAESEMDSLREMAAELSESTVCEKGELDWSEDSIYASVPRMVSALIRRK